MNWVYRTAIQPLLETIKNDAKHFTDPVRTQDVIVGIIAAQLCNGGQEMMDAMQRVATLCDLLTFQMPSPELIESGRRTSEEIDEFFIRVCCTYADSYYFGKVLGDIISMLAGIGVSEASAKVTIAGVGATVTTGGAISVAAVPIIIEGVLVAEVGIEFAAAAAMNGVGDLVNYKSRTGSTEKPSLKPYKNNKEANEQSVKQGYKDAHDLKKDYVDKNSISKYDMKYDTKTGEIYLESKDGSIQIPTGLYNIR